MSVLSLTFKNLMAQQAMLCMCSMQTGAGVLSNQLHTLIT